MQIGMIGLGRMGANLVRRLMRGGHECVVYDLHADAVKALASEGASPAGSLAELSEKLDKPRAVWMMVPAFAVESTLEALTRELEPGDIAIDGGNSHYQDDIRRAKDLVETKLHYVDVGTSGGVWGLARGFCQMIGGEDEIVRHLDPIFSTLAPGLAAVERTPGREGDAGTAEKGYLHCGPNGAGHFVKMVHNGIEYGLMAAYSEGFNLLAHANAGASKRSADAETSPIAKPEHYRYELNLADIAELWRRGSVITSWLLDLSATALVRDPALESFAGRVSDSGEGRWTIEAGIETSVPTPVLAAALYQRFSSRGESELSDKLLSAMRFGFGGHLEKKEEK